MYYKSIFFWESNSSPFVWKSGIDAEIREIISTSPFPLNNIVTGNYFRICFLLTIFANILCANFCQFLLLGSF